jgi:hypothetical protein
MKKALVVYKNVKSWDTLEHSVTRGALNAALEPVPERKPSIDKSLTL